MKLKLAACYLAAAVSVATAAYANDTLVRDGATCDVPDGFNVGPYDALWNSKGMADFCVFPLKPFADAIGEALETCQAQGPAEIPECGQLVLGQPQEYPCYELVTEAP